jgi:hypothetical protein
MKALLVVLVLLLIGIVSLGFYRVWFNLSSDNADHKSNVTFTVDQDKFKEDEEMAKEKVQGLGQKAKEKAGDRTDRVKEQDSERAKEKVQDLRVGPNTNSGDFDTLSGTDKRKNN